MAKTSSTGVICPGSNQIYDELLNCLCNGPCAKQCEADAYCSPDGTAVGDCDTCMQANTGCNLEFTDCANDH